MHFLATFVDHVGVTFTKLAGELLGDLVEGGVKVFTILLGVDVWPCDTEVGFDSKSFIRRFAAVVGKHHVSGQDLSETFERLKFLGDVVANGSSETEVPWINMDLHGSFLLLVVYGHEKRR